MSSSSTGTTSLSTQSSTTATPIATTITPITTTSFTLLGTGAVAVIIFAGYYYINRKPAPAKPAEQPPPQKDAAFFKMQ